MFTAETARNAGLKSVQARLNAKNARIERERQLEEVIRTVVGPVLERKDPTDYLARRLRRVREQIERVSDMLDHEKEPQKLDRLAACLERLCELERTLDNRPLPGSRRPGREPARRSVAISDPQPAASTPPVVLPEPPQV